MDIISAVEYESGTCTFLACLGLCIVGKKMMRNDRPKDLGIYAEDGFTQISYSCVL